MTVHRSPFIRAAIVATLGLATLAAGLWWWGPEVGRRLGREEPASAVRSPDDALSTFEVADAFAVELLAAEPLVQDPVALAWDERGRAWVCEMTGYMLDAEASGEEAPNGRIVILEDTDRDGVLDKRTVFLDDVVLPRAIVVVQGGVLYADNDSLYFVEERAGVAGRRDVVDAMYARIGSVWDKPNGLLYNLDNWIYSSRSERRYRILRLAARVPEGSKEIYRNHLWKLVRGATARRGQWGLSRDDYGRLFHVRNGEAVRGERMLPGALTHNPRFRPPLPLGTLLGTLRVFPVRRNSAVSRGDRPGVLDDAGRLTEMAAACGAVVYRGAQFPSAFYGTVFVADPAANVVKGTSVVESGGAFSGRDLFVGHHILASRDERFRPVNLYNGPDGSVTIVDFHRGVIQHRNHITDYLEQEIQSRQLFADPHMGRLYRLRHRTRALIAHEDMSALGPAELIDYLGHANAWHRDSATRLLVEKGDARILPMLLATIETHREPLAVINALWVLEGMGAVSLPAVRAGLANPDVKVKLNALAVSEALAGDQRAKIPDMLSKLSDTSDPELARGIASVAGRFRDPDAFAVLGRLVEQFDEDPLVVAAGLSGLSGHETFFLQAVVGDRDDGFRKSVEALIAPRAAGPASGFAKLDASARESFRRGKRLFESDAGCFSCHGEHGEGLPGRTPPLDQNAVVIGSAERLASLLLYGSAGADAASSGESVEPGAMPGLVGRSDISHRDVADIMTYLRNAWTNEVGPVSEVVVETAQARAASGSRQ